MKWLKDFLNGSSFFLKILRSNNIQKVFLAQLSNDFLNYIFGKNNLSYFVIHSIIFYALDLLTMPIFTHEYIKTILFFSKCIYLR